MLKKFSYQFLFISAIILFSCEVQHPVLPHIPNTKKEAEIKEIEKSFLKLKEKLLVFFINTTVDSNIKITLEISNEDLTALSVTINHLQDSIKKAIYQKFFTRVLWDLSQRTSGEIELILSKNKTAYFPVDKILNLNIYDSKIDYFVSNLELLQTFLLGSENISFSTITPDIKWDTMFFLINEKENILNNMETLEITTDNLFPSIKTDGRNLSINIMKIPSEYITSQIEIHNAVNNLNNNIYCGDKTLFFKASFDNFPDTQKFFKLKDDLTSASNIDLLCSYLEDETISNNIYMTINDSNFHHLIKENKKTLIFWKLKHDEEKDFETLLNEIFNLF